ncbi:MAG: hypothetical protein ICV85_13125, partial [Tolypothrix sp. T3-bin4]|nr:hypothetical protein [Tolypothrix sp. Co-bin9]MBD0303072.1 hypothetical protein [Tolypothrix sp. T3-bin4]
MRFRERYDQALLLAIAQAKKSHRSLVFATLFQSTDSRSIATLLESPYPNKSDRTQLTHYSICAGAPRIVNGQPQMWMPPLGKVLPFLEKLLTGQGEQDQFSSPLSPSSPSPP